MKLSLLLGPFVANVAIAAAMSLVCRHCYKHCTSIVDGSGVNQISGSVDTDCLVPGMLTAYEVRAHNHCHIQDAEQPLLRRTS